MFWVYRQYFECSCRFVLLRFYPMQCIFLLSLNALFVCLFAFLHLVFPFVIHYLLFSLFFFFHYSFFPVAVYVHIHTMRFTWKSPIDVCWTYFAIGCLLCCLWLRDPAVKIRIWSITRSGMFYESSVFVYHLETVAPIPLHCTLWVRRFENTLTGKTLWMNFKTYRIHIKHIHITHYTSSPLKLLPFVFILFYFIAFHGFELIWFSSLQTIVWFHFKRDSNALIWVCEPWVPL